MLNGRENASENRKTLIFLGFFGGDRLHFFEKAV